MRWLSYIPYVIFSTVNLAFTQDLISIQPGAAGGSTGSIKAVHTNVLAMYGNKAGIAWIEDLSLYASAERRWNLNNLEFYSLVGTLPTDLGNFGVSLQHFGFDLYQEQLLGLAYARKLSGGISMGVQFESIQVSIPSYGRKRSYTAELGILAKLSPEFVIGFHAYNPFEIKWVEAEALPSVLMIGTSYQPYDEVWVAAELEKVIGMEENIKLGIQYQPGQRLSLRLGVTSNPPSYSFGVGYKFYHGLIIDAGSVVHPQLGINPLAGIGYQVSKDSKQ